MLKSTILSGLFFLSPFLSVAQWIHEPSVTDPELYDLHSDGGQLVVTGSSGVWIRENEKSGWEFKSIQSDIDLVASFTTHQQNWYAGVLDGAVYRSDNQGDSWEPLTAGYPVFGDPPQFLYPQSLTVWKNQVVTGTVGSGVYQLNGKTWQAMNSGLISNLHYNINQLFTDGDTLIASAGANGTFAYRSPDGSDWSHTPFGTFSGEILFILGGVRSDSGSLLLSATNGIYRASSVSGPFTHVAPSSRFFSFAPMVQSGDSVYLFLSRLTGSYLLTSGDDGLTWNQTQWWPGTVVYDMVTLNDTLWISTSTGVYHQAVKKTPVSVKEPELPSAFSLGIVYPNPVNPSAQFDLTVHHSTNVNLTLYSITGQILQQVYAGPVGPGSHSFRIDAAGLSSQVAFIRAEGEGRQMTRKVVILK